MKEVPIFFLRKFLNHKGHHSNAFIFAEIVKSNVKNRKTKKVEYWREADLKIGDCDRIVNLSMDLHSISEAKNALYKLDILINSLVSFRKAFIKEMHLLKRKK